MQGGNDVDYPGVISTSCQHSSCAVIGRPGGRRGEKYKMHLFVDNAINSTCCLECYLEPSRIQAENKRNLYPATGRDSHAMTGETIQTGVM
ncbi:hypothetical protein BMS3Bbin14_01394 [bacterium BMS3Bbin14]|nr:hypothetical protein BMS3Bbin14_01394 [bacterium BMS3Bbin14]